MKRGFALLLAVLLTLGTIPLPAAWPYAADGSSFYDGVADMSAFETALTAGVARDPLGGLRLAADGTSTVPEWTSQNDFRGLGPGPLVELATLATVGPDATSSAGGLTLYRDRWGLSVDASSPVVSPSPSVKTDGWEVQAPSVVRTTDASGAVTYRMFYTGVAADGYVQRVFEATSAAGTATWNKLDGDKTGGAVLDVGAEGGFDARGLVHPAVVFDASATPSYRMYYGALSDAGGTIGSASSTDGVHWTKYEEPTGTPAPILRPGAPGSADGYSVGEPSVTYDATSGVYRMWYAASPTPDVGGRQVGYATSTNGVSWQKGGLISLTGSNGNWNGGWFSPSVWQETSVSAGMLFAGKKIGDQPYKLIVADSTDGLVWGTGQIILNNGSAGSFDENNVFWSSILYEPWAAPASLQQRFFYTGNGGSGDSARNAIGYATWSGSGGGTSQGKVLDRSAPSTRFDSNQTAGASVTRVFTGPAFRMIYGGRSAADLLWRLGYASSDDGSAWAKVDGAGDAARAAVLSLGGIGAFDASGALAPSVVAVDAQETTFTLFYEGRTAGATPVSSIGMATSTASSFEAWSKSGLGLGVEGSGFDARDVAHPSAVRLGNTYWMAYAGRAVLGGAWQIGVATETAGPDGFPGLFDWRTDVPAVAQGGPGDIDGAGAYDPVLAYDASTTPAWSMLYTAEDTRGVQRLASATSSDGVTWVKQGLAMAPTARPYAFDEVGVRAAGASRDAVTGEWDVYFDGVDRGNAGNSAASLPLAWRRIGHATSRGAGYVGAGQASYALVPTAPTAPNYGYEFKDFSWDATAPAGTDAHYELSYYPAGYTPSGTSVDAWSPYVSLDQTITLPLETQMVRWRVRFERTTDDASMTPTLDAFRLEWAPVHFETTGTALSIPVSPPAGNWIESWNDLTVSARVPAGTDVQATVIDPTGGVLAGPTAVSNGQTVISLATLPIGLSSVRVRFDLSGDGETTPYIDNWAVSYSSTNRAPVQGFKAQGHDTSVTVSWNETGYPEFGGTTVLRKLTGFPTGPTDASATPLYDVTTTTAQPLVTVGDTGTGPATPLVNGTPYYYAAWTRTDETTPQYSPPAYAVGIPKKPIQGFKAAAGTSRVALSWLAPATYPARLGTVLVRREATLPTGPFAEASQTVVARDLPGTSFVDTSVANGIKYYYAAYTHDMVLVDGRQYHGYSDPSFAYATPKLTPTMTLVLQRYNRRIGSTYRYAFGRRVYFYGKAWAGGRGLRGKVVAYAYRKVYNARLRKYVWLKVAYSARTLYYRTTYSYWTYNWLPRARGTYQIRHYFAGDGLHFSRWGPVAYAIVY